MNKNIVLFGVIIITLSVALSGCNYLSSEEGKKFIGTWEAENSAMITFSSNNICSYGDSEAKWDIKDEKLIITIDSSGEIMTFNYKFSNDYKTLSIQEIGSDFVIYTKIIDSIDDTTLTIKFQKQDKEIDNKLTVVSVNPTNINWSDLELHIDGTIISHGKTGLVAAGNVLNITSLAGTGDYTVSIKHLPTNTLIGEYDFTDEEIETPSITFQIEDKSSDNKLTVISVDPSDINWEDFELQIDGTSADHSKTGLVKSGDVLDITSLAGKGAYTISIIYNPTNALIGSYSFSASTIEISEIYMTDASYEIISIDEAHKIIYYNIMINLINEGSSESDNMTIRLMDEDYVNVTRQGTIMPMDETTFVFNNHPIVGLNDHVVYLFYYPTSDQEYIPDEVNHGEIVLILKYG